MKITKGQLRRIIKEAIGDQLPYSAGQPWQDPDVPVGSGARTHDDLDTELTDKEMDDAGYFEEDGWPLSFGYTDKAGEKVEFIANNSADADEFFAMLFRDYGRDHPYSVN